MLHPANEKDPIPNPEPAQSFGGLDIHPFSAMQRYVSFYPYYLPSSYVDYYPKNFGRYYQPVSYVDSVSVKIIHDDSKHRKKCPISKPLRWPLLIAVIALFVFLYLRSRR